MKLTRGKTRSYITQNIQTVSWQQQLNIARIFREFTESVGSQNGCKEKEEEKERKNVKVRGVNMGMGAVCVGPAGY